MYERARAPEEFTNQLARDQYTFVNNLINRRLAYLNAQPPIDWGGNAYHFLDLAGNETIMDVGCGSADVLDTLHARYGHRGRMIGVDIDENMFFAARQRPAVQAGAVELRVGEAQHLDVADSSVDVLLALFLLYHVPSPEQAIAEFKRVVKPGGQILIATSSRRNKSVHRLIEKAIGNILDVPPPPLFIEPFSNETADEVLPQWFHDIEHHVLTGELRLTPDNPNTHAHYYASLESMLVSYGGHISYHGEWRPVIQQYVEPRIKLVEDVKGYFRDMYDLHYYSCRNDKPIMA